MNPQYEWIVYSDEMYIWSKIQLFSGKASSTTYLLWSQILQKLWCQNMERTPSDIWNGVLFDTFKNMIKAWSWTIYKTSVCCLLTTWLSYHIHV